MPKGCAGATRRRCNRQRFDPSVGLAKADHYWLRPTRSPITRHCDFGAKEPAKPRVTQQVGLSLPRERYPRNRAWKPHERQSRRLPQGPRKRTKIEYGCMALPYLEQTCRWREPNLHGELSERFWSLQSRIPRFNRAGRMSALGQKQTFWPSLATSALPQ